MEKKTLPETKKTSIWTQTWENLKNRGMVFASTRFLVNKMLNQSEILPQTDTQTHVVEVGAGSGGFTKGLMKFMEKNQKMILTVVELEKKYEATLKTITQKFSDRVNVIIGSVTDLPQLVSQPADIVVSALPFGSLNENVRTTALDHMYKLLKQGGEYLQFQYLRSNLSQFRQKFQQAGKIGWTALNLPPAFVYRFTKKIPSE